MICHALLQPSRSPQKIGGLSIQVRQDHKFEVAADIPLIQTSALEDCASARNSYRDCAPEIRFSELCTFRDSMPRGQRSEDARQQACILKNGPCQVRSEPGRAVELGSTEVCVLKTGVGVTRTL